MPSGRKKKAGKSVLFDLPWVCSTIITLVAVYHRMSSLSGSWTEATCPTRPCAVSDAARRHATTKATTKAKAPFFLFAQITQPFSFLSFFLPFTPLRFRSRPRKKYINLHLVSWEEMEEKGKERGRNRRKAVKTGKRLLRGGKGRVEPLCLLLHILYANGNGENIFASCLCSKCTKKCLGIVVKGKKEPFLFVLCLVRRC